MSIFSATVGTALNVCIVAASITWKSFKNLIAGDSHDEAFRLLEQQFARCGPESSNAHPCPPCHECPNSLGVAALFGCVSFACGALCTSVIYWAHFSHYLLAVAGVAHEVNPSSTLTDGEPPRWVPPEGSSARQLRGGPVVTRAITHS